ncbi:hypothetical protein AVEN_95926-1 [Araneus ventricosus]|uniref:Galactosyltransferase N-terminal domain-containing protein n=1 Tax=Araneus ventricosus TaxID=182803 RepID=A0A4Y2JGQ9_ARAVE|nr:hypothetical protein AVEN_95926-1 [Araneus ventricosus]
MFTPLFVSSGGRLRLDVSLHNRTDVEELLRRSPYLRGRGSWTPRDCVPQHRVALIIPYRDRLEHLTTLLYTLHPLLQRQLLEYRVYVVEQVGVIFIFLVVFVLFKSLLVQ